MEKLNEKALNYATEKSSQILNAATAQAYIDGYRDGYKDREEEIAVDLRGNNTDYIDLGLPSGTLWSTSFEKESDTFLYLPYNKAISLNIPTQEQWEELMNICKWKGESGMFCCVGPNGAVLSFAKTGYIQVISEKTEIADSFFWIRNINNELNEVEAAHMFVCGRLYYSIDRLYRGFKLPIRLVRQKQE